MKRASFFGLFKFNYIRGFSQRCVIKMSVPLDGFIEGYYVNYNSGIKYPLLSYNNVYFVIFINSVFRK